MIKRIILKSVRIYQKYISPCFMPRCKYMPTCSQYTYEAIEKHGPIKGLSMGLWRILRCNPLSKGGYDPVR